MPEVTREQATVQRIADSAAETGRTALLSCGHDHCLYPGKRLKIGAAHDCEKCRAKEKS